MKTITAHRVLSALQKDPLLLFEVAVLMGATNVPVLSPWTPIEKTDTSKFLVRKSPSGKPMSTVVLKYTGEQFAALWKVFPPQSEDPSKEGETFTLLAAQHKADEAATKMGWTLT